MGDTLAGMITSFVGQFDNFKEAVTSATYMHSFIGENYLTQCMLFHLRLISEIPYVMKQLEG